MSDREPAVKKILHVVDIDASRDATFDAISTEAGLSSWWTTVVAATQEEGSVIDFTFLDGFNPDMEVATLDRPGLVEWRCVGGHEPWADNTFRFEIVEIDDGARTRLRFTQVYATELDDDTYGTYNFNWGYYLESLRCYLADGEGMPFDAG